MRKRVILLTSLLLLAAVCAGELEVVQKHVYTGEEFELRYTTYGPATEQKLEPAFMEQTQVIFVPELEYGEPFTATVKFTAPAFAGEYSIGLAELEVDVAVEEPRFALTDVKVEPSIIRPRETAKVSYTIENVGDAVLYNVKGKVSILLGAESDYEFDSWEEELFATMGPGEKRTVVKEITARESAEGQERIGIEVAYSFDNEKHYARGDALLTVGGMPWMEILVIVLLIVVVGRVVLARYL